MWKRQKSRRKRQLMGTLLVGSPTGPDIQLGLTQRDLRDAIDPGWQPVILERGDIELAA